MRGGLIEEMVNDASRRWNPTIWRRRRRRRSPPSAELAGEQMAAMPGAETHPVAMPERAKEKAAVEQEGEEDVEIDACRRGSTPSGKRRRETRVENECFRVSSDGAPASVRAPETRSRSTESSSALLERLPFAHFEHAAREPIGSHRRGAPSATPRGGRERDGGGRLGRRARGVHREPRSNLLRSGRLPSRVFASTIASARFASASRDATLSAKRRSAASRSSTTARAPRGRRAATPFRRRSTSTPRRRVARRASSRRPRRGDRVVALVEERGGGDEGVRVEGGWMEMRRAERMGWDRGRGGGERTRREAPIARRAYRLHLRAEGVDGLLRGRERGLRLIHAPRRGGVIRARGLS